MARYIYSYHQERGDFHGFVEDEMGNMVWQCHYPEYYEDDETGELVESSSVFDDGYMEHTEDTAGLSNYLNEIGIMKEEDELDTEQGYARGGAIENKVKSRLSKNFELPLEMAVYVPSTEKANQVISKRDFASRVDEVRSYLAQLFGGYSSTSVDGGYVSDEKGLIQEDIVKVIAFAQKDGFESKANKLFDKIKNWAKSWGQESIGFEFEGDLFYIDSNAQFKLGGEIKSWKDFDMSLSKFDVVKVDGKHYVLKKIQSSEYGNKLYFVGIDDSNTGEGKYLLTDFSGGEPLEIKDFKFGGVNLGQSFEKFKNQVLPVKINVPSEVDANQILKYADLQGVPSSMRAIGDAFLVVLDRPLEVRDSMEARIKELLGLKSYAKGGATDDLLGFKIPEWAMVAIVNDDRSGLYDEDIERLDNFLERLVKKYGNANLMLGDIDGKDNLGFGYRNDIDGNLGSNSFRMYLRPTKEYAQGGETPKVYEKVNVTIRDVDMGGEVIYKHAHWFNKNDLDNNSKEKLGKHILNKYGFDYGNTYKFDIKRTGETREKYDGGGELKDSLPLEKKIRLTKSLPNNEKELAVIDVELKLEDKKTNWETLDRENGAIVCSMSGLIKNANTGRDISGGQNLDEIAKMFPQNKDLQELVSYWKEYHLNDMEAGTIRQTKAIDEWLSKGNRYDYSKALEYLKSIDLDEDRGYSYGSKWLYQPIPKNVVERIVELTNKLSEGKYAQGGKNKWKVDPTYTHFALNKNTNKIVNGWDYSNTDNESIKHYSKIDLKDNDMSMKDYKLLTASYLKRMGIDPFDSDNWGNSYAKGGKVTFQDKVDAISKGLKGEKVSKKYQKEYGKTYDKEESVEAARRIAGAMRAKEMGTQKK